MLSKTIVKYIQSLAHKKVRDEEHAFIAEGPKVVSELLESGFFPCRAIYSLPAWSAENNALLKVADVENTTIETADLERISQLQTPNKVVAIFSKRDRELSSLTGKLSLMLDEIQDPGNMGTIIRTADWFGLENIICSRGCADIYNPKVVQSTMGSLSRVCLYYTSLDTFIQEHPETPVYAATLGGKNMASIQVKEGILLVGNESKGVKKELLQLVKEEVSIAAKGKAESLNAAVACGIILSHWVK